MMMKSFTTINDDSLTTELQIVIFQIYVLYRNIGKNHFLYFLRPLATRL